MGSGCRLPPLTAVPPRQPNFPSHQLPGVTHHLSCCRRALIAVLTWRQVQRWRRSSGGEEGGPADATAAAGEGETKASKATGPSSFAITARASSEGSSGGSSGGDTPRPQAGRPVAAAAEDDVAAIDRAAHAIVDAAEEEAQRKWVAK